MTSPILKAKDLEKSFDATKLLDGISLEIFSGKSYAIMGKSGIGKTTLLHILAGLESKDTGSLFIDEKKMSFQNSNQIRNKHIGFVFQSNNLLEDISCLENLLMPLKIARKKITSDVLKSAIDLLNQVGILGKAHTQARFLSGGEKQRLAIARALINEQKLIFADEPTGNLDRDNSEKIHQLLFDFVKNKNVALIIATHDTQLADLCDYKYLLKDGQLKPH